MEADLIAKYGLLGAMLVLAAARLFESALKRFAPEFVKQQQEAREAAEESLWTRTKEITDRQNEEIRRQGEQITRLLNEQQLDREESQKLRKSLVTVSEERDQERKRAEAAEEREAELKQRVTVLEAEVAELRQQVARLAAGNA